MKKILLIIGLIIIVGIGITIYVNYYVSASSEGFLYDDVKLIPFNNVGVLLGTSKTLSNGRINEYWKNRIDATVVLFKSGKIKFILISGDNSRKNYDEPTDMKNELITAGIPDSIIYLDYAGFRTFDSMIRANKIFGQTSFTVISQKFHNQRAVYIARHYGLNAIGYNANEVTAFNGFKTKIREKIARVLLMIDLLTGHNPKYLGERVQIG